MRRLASGEPFFSRPVDFLLRVAVLRRAVFRRVFPRLLRVLVLFLRVAAFFFFLRVRLVPTARLALLSKVLAARVCSAAPANPPGGIPVILAIVVHTSCA